MEIIDTISQIVERADVNGGNDFYIDGDGFKVCRKCGTRMQTEIKLPWGRMKMPIMCKCRAEQDREEKRRFELEQAQIRVEGLRTAGLMDREYLSYRLENDDRKNAKISDAVVRYIDKWDDLKAKNTGIMFYGPVGTGKTFYSGVIANALIDRGIPVMMASLPALVSAMSRGFDENKTEIMQKLSRWPLVILDDVGVERQTEWMSEKVNEIIDARYLSGLPMIVTTNLSPGEMKSPQDLRYQRIFDRIIERCYPIAVTGESRRKEAAKQNRAEIADILGV